MRLDVSHKGQLQGAVRKVAAILALAASGELSGDQSDVNMDDDDASPREEAPQKEELVYPRSRLTRAARAAIVAARVARTRATLTEDEGEERDDIGSGHGLAARAAVAATAAEAAAADAIALSMRDSSAGVDAAQLQSQSLCGPNPNSVGRYRPLQDSSSSKSRPSVVLDPTPPEVPRPLRVGARTFRPAARPPAYERANHGSMRGCRRSQTPKTSHVQDPQSRQLPGWQQTKRSVHGVAGQTRVTEYAYVVDTGALAVDGVSAPGAKPVAAVLTAAATAQQEQDENQAETELLVDTGALAVDGVSAPGAKPVAAVLTTVATATAQQEQDENQAETELRDDQETEHLEDEERENRAGRSKEARQQPQQEVHQQPEEAKLSQGNNKTADVAETADKAWKKMRFSQKMATFSPKEEAKRCRKLRQMILHYYMHNVRYGLVELRDVLASEPFSKAINNGEQI